MDGGEVGPFTRFIWRPVSNAVDQFKEGRHEVLTKYKELLKDYEKNLTWEKIDARELNGYTFTDKAELIGALLHTGNRSNMEKLILGGRGENHAWGYIAEDGGLDTTAWDMFIQRMWQEGKLTKADYDFIQSVWDLFESIKPQAQKAHYDMYGFYFSEITANEFETPFGTYRGGYAPAVMDSDLVTRAQQFEDKAWVEGMGNSFMFPTTGKGFTIERTGITRPLKLSLSLVQSHIDKTMRFIHLESHIKDVARLINSYDLKTALERNDSNSVNTLLIPWLQRSALQSVETPTPGKDRKVINDVSRWLRRNVGLHIMVGNVANTVQQFTGLSMAATEVRPKYLNRALMRWTSGPHELAELIAEKSIMMKNRNMQSAFDVQAGIDDILKPGVYNDIRRLTAQHGYFLQAFTQKIVDNVVWSGAYDQAIELGVSEDEAIQRADAAVRLTQGSFDAQDLSRLEVSSPFVRMFTMFMSYFNMQGNLILTKAGNIIENSTGSERAAKLAYVYVMGFMIPAVLSEIITSLCRGQAGDDDDDEIEIIAAKLFFGSQVRTAVAMVPGGNVATAALNRYLDKKAFNDRINISPIPSLLESGMSAPGSVYKAVADDGSVKKAIKDSLAAIGVITGVPVGWIGRPTGYMADVEQGRVKVRNEADFVRGLIHGTGPKK